MLFRSRPASSICLRSWTDSAGDIESILRAFDVDDMAAQSSGPISSEAAARRWVEPWMDSAAQQGVAFAIDIDGTAVGHVLASAIDHRHDTAWISYWVTPEQRGAGLASRGLAGLADHCLGALELFRLELAYRVNNPSSAAVARNAGFLVEGVERAKLRYLDESGKPQRFDVETCARLRSDPPASVAPLRVCD